MISPSHIDAQGNVTLWEKTDDGARPVKLHATDAVHALMADAERWSLFEPKAKAKREKKAKDVTGEPEITGDATEGDYE